MIIDNERNHSFYCLVTRKLQYILLSLIITFKVKKDAKIHKKEKKENETFKVLKMECKLSDQNRRPKCQQLVVDTLIIAHS